MTAATLFDLFDTHPQQPSGRRVGNYTDEDKDQIYDLRGKKSAGLVALQFGLTRNTVIGIWFRESRLRGHEPLVVKLDGYQSRPKTPLHRSGGPRLPRPRQFKEKPLRLSVVNSPAPEPLNVSMADIDLHQCRFPYGDGPYVFCGHPQHPGSSYCVHHHAMTHQSEEPCDTASKT